MTDDELKALVAGLAVSQAVTDQELKALVASSAASQAETDRKMQESIKEADRQMQETREFLKKSAREADKRKRELDRQMQEAREFLKKSSREADKRGRELDRQMQDTDKRLKQLSQDIGGVSHSNALVAEEYFLNALRDKLEFGGMHFDSVDVGRNRSVKLPDGSKIKGQYDIILANGEAAAIIEVKYKTRTEDVEKILKTDVDKFKLLYPEYKNYKLYFGIAGLNLDEYVERKALESGIGVLRQKGKVAEILGSNLRAF